MGVVQIKVDASDAIHKIRAMERRTAQYTPVFAVAKAKLAMSNVENFTSHGLPSGGWEPLAGSTLAWKARHGFPPAPLVASGALMSSLASLTGPPNEIRAKSASFGTSVEYAKFHQYGAHDGSWRLPKRLVVFVPQGFARAMANVTADYLVHGVAGAALGAVTP